MENKKLDKFIVSIDFYFRAENEDEALSIADGIADYIETAHERGDMLTPYGLEEEIQAKVNEPSLEE